jgi:hypothetical protein
MKRIYLLLGAMLIATSMVALALVGPAGAKSKSKKYTAIVASNSTAITASGDATTKRGAIKKAWRQCDSTASNEYPSFYTGDCNWGVWVKNGWAAIAWEGTLEGPPFSTTPSGGWGWGDTRSEAKDNALNACQSSARESCTVDRSDRSRKYNPFVHATGGGI